MSDSHCLNVTQQWSKAKRKPGHVGWATQTQFDCLWKESLRIPRADPALVCRALRSPAGDQGTAWTFSCLQVPAVQSTINCCTAFPCISQTGCCFVVPLPFPPISYESLMLSCLPTLPVQVKGKEKKYKWNRWQRGSWGKMFRGVNSFWGQTSVCKIYICRTVMCTFMWCYVFLHVSM